ncbi:MAG TPA: hypothetical protein VJX67_07275, partial [Blastocatellia bacterium]|nr:hypothetical protein [Blastocatellia bacterium]
FPTAIEEILAALRDPLGVAVIETLGDLEVPASELGNVRFDRFKWEDGGGGGKSDQLDGERERYTMQLDFSVSISASRKHRVRKQEDQ